MKKVIFIFIAIIMFILIGSVFAANHYVNDESVQGSDTLFRDSKPKRAMFIFAHPDDEITSAGTISKMSKEPGAEITLVYMTKGEAGPTAGLVPQAQLGEVRAQEAKQAGKTLGADRVEILSYPDGGLPAIDDQEAKESIRQLIKKYNPSVIITFDERVGFYGHLDHATTGRWVKEATAEDKGKTSVTAVYQATLPQPMIDLALQLSQTFKEKYPIEPDEGLPAATVAISMSSEYKEKRELLDVHKTQVDVIGDVQPYYNKLPSWVYYHIFSKEYYTRIL
ncbi:PIG-L family deacetylase [Bacillus sp. 165]|uniref:PIG-L deacetylase family protein n=1 Tax=Bacillus sp. 165 TaxID=1529117 RepID=UPI001AD98CCB|nr:PIG-L family deacetylase [Bacillus sp. 165]MBO9131177.1 PIG-L family deacetylase [Bacillus sp. 165]